MHTLAQIQSILEQNNISEDILFCSLYGSRLFGNNHEKSDFDYLVILDNDNDIDELKCNFEGSIDGVKIDIQTFSRKSFRKYLDYHKVICFEMMSTPDHFIVKNIDFEKEFPFAFDVTNLRSANSSRVSHSWVKAKKKMTVEKDLNVYNGKKSLWHCFRMTMFAIQIAEHQMIYDFTVANDLYKEIMSNPSENWKDYYDLYNDKLNKLMSKFRELAPKKNEEQL